MSFARPEMFWLLAAVAVWLVVAHRRARRDRRDAATAWSVLGLRLALFTALVVALARPVWDAGGSGGGRVVVADVSTSAGDVGAVVSRIEAWAAEPNVRVVAFAERATEVVRRDGRFDLDGALAHVGRRDASDAEAALDLAGALAAPGDVVSLVADGRETDGDAHAAAARLATRDVRVDVHPHGARAASPVLVAPTVPAQAPVGTSVAIPIVVEAAGERTLRARVGCTGRADRIVALETTRGIARGRVVHEVVAGMNELSVAIESADAGEIARRDLAVFGGAPLAVTLIEDAASPSRIDAVRALLGPSARVTRRTAPELRSDERFDDTDFAIVCDVPAAAFKPGAIRALGDAAADGLGVLVTGGRRSLGVGGYRGSDFERFLPVRFPQKEERRDPSATLVIIIDTSGSMGGTRIDLAKEVARLALKRLKPHDKAGIVEFHGAKRWAAPIQPAANSVDIMRALNRLNAGGGTVILPAIDEAYYGLLNARTRTRHLLVLTDGGVEQGAFEPLVRKMAAAGMTLSTVLVGPGSHSDFLVSLAQWGRGRYYHAPDRFNLPEVIVKQPESSLLEPAVESTVAVRAVGDSFLVDTGALDGAPPIVGRVEVEPRPTADVLVETAGGEPLLTAWRHGAGRVAVWSTELAGPWTDGLAGWAGYSRALSAWVRDGARARRTGRVSLRAWSSRGAVDVFAWRDDADGPARAPLTVRIDGRSQVVAPCAGSGFDAAVAVRFHPRPGRHAVVVRDGDDVCAQGAVVAMPAPEWSRAEPDTARLERIAAATGGRADGGSSAPRARERRDPQERWPLFLWLALPLLLALVGVRRWSGRGAAVLAFVCVTAAGTDGIAQTPTLSDAERAHVDRAIADAADPDAVSELVRAIRIAHGRLDALIAHLATVAEARPAAGRLLARVASIDGRPERAAGVLGRLEAADTLDAGGLAEYSRVLERLGRSADALAALERAIEAVDDPAIGIAMRVRRASLWLERDETAPRAIADLRALIGAVPGQPDLHFYLAFVAALHGHPALLFELEPRREPAKAVFRERLIVGHYRLLAKDTAGAQRDFEAALRAAPLTRDRRFAQERLIAAHRVQGTLDALADRWLAEADRPPERLDALVALLRELQRPDEALALLLGRGDADAARGRTGRRMQREVIALALECGKPDAVETIYRQLIERDPTRVEWRSGLALLHFLRGDRERGAEVFRAAQTALADDGKGLLALATEADGLSLPEQARGAAEAAIALGDGSALLGGLFLVDLDARAGDRPAAMKRLTALETAHADDSPALMRIADAFERHRDIPSAIRILARVVERSATEDTLMRLAWLRQSAGETNEAAALWRSLWETTKLPARTRQAEDRMLELASRHGRLADLAVDLEEALEQGRGGARELHLLVKLYARAHDAVSAVEVLETYGGKLGKGEVDTLQNMAHVYQHCDDYRRYEETLARLQRIDPDNAIDYQQQIVIGALERRRGRQAKRGLDRLRAMAPGDVNAEEFAAGVLAMVGLPEEAIEAYTRVVATHPDRIEDFLLLANAMRDVGRAAQAQHLFLDLMENAAKDDLFTIAVDGLLNLRAPAPILRIARRRVIERIAARPAKAFLYQLAADLAEELRERDEQVNVLTLMVVVSGERRSSVLRELMDLEGSRRHFDEMIDHGRSLLALGEEMPPQVFLDLGRALIRVGDLATAERVFARTRIAGDYIAVQQQIAGYYEEAGHAASAARILRQALLARPDDVALLARVGTLAEIAGDLVQARRDYRRAFDVMIERSAGHTGTARTVRGRNRNRSQDAYKDHGDTVTAGLVAAAADPAAFIAALERRTLAELERLRGAEAKDGFSKKLADYPRLSRLLDFARMTALHHGAIDVADRIDEAVVGAHFKEDRAARTALFRPRTGLGFGRAAIALATRYGDKTNAVLARAEALGSTEPPKDTAAAAQRIADLVSVGLVDPAAAALAAIDPATIVKVSTARSLAASAFALGDTARVGRIATRWCTLGMSAKRADREVSAALTVGWGAWNDDERNARLEAIAAKAEETASEGTRDALEEVLARVDASRGIARETTEAQWKRWLDPKPRSLSGSVRTILRAPAAYRPAMLQTQIDRLGNKLRPYDVLGSAVTFADAVDDSLGAVLAAGLRSATIRANMRPESFLFHVTRLLQTDAAPSFKKAALDFVRARLPDDDNLRLLDAWLAFESNPDTATTDALVARAAKLLAGKQLSYHANQLLTKLANDRRPAVRALLERAFEEASERGLAWHFARAIVERTHGDLVAEYRVLDALRTKSPGNYTAMSLLANNLARRGRAADAARCLADAMKNLPTDNTYLFRRVAELHRTAWRPEEALAAARRVKGRYASADVLALSLLDSLGRDDECREAFVAATVGLRSRFVYGDGWPPALHRGGRSAKGIDPSSAFRGIVIGGVSTGRAPWTEVIAEREWAAPSIERLWRAQSTAGRPGPTASAVAAARLAADGSSTWAARMRERLAAGRLADPDFATAVRLLERGALALADRDALLVELRVQAIAGGPRGTAARLLPAALEAIDDRRARRVIARSRLASGLVAQRFGRTAIDDAFEELEGAGDDIAATVRALDGLRLGLGATAHDPTPIAALYERVRVHGTPEQTDAFAEWLSRVLDTVASYYRQTPGGLAARIHLAIHAMQRGDDAAFARHLDALGDGLQGSVLRDALASLVSTPGIERLVRSLDDALAARLAPAPLAAVRADCAGALVDGGHREAARALLARALPDLGEAAQPALVAADVARALGDEATAHGIERALLERNALNVLRIEDTLAAIERDEGVGVADRLALSAAAVTDHPAVLARAIAAAERGGDGATAERLTKRLDRIRPPSR